MEINEKFQDLIPALQPEEFVGLENSIKLEGCRDSLILWNDILIDGHNRYLICKKYNIPFETKSKEFESEDEVIIWIIDNQLNRRNISNYDRTILALKKEDILKPIAKENQVRKPGVVGQKSSPQKEESKTKTKIAKIAKVSHDTVAKVKFLEEHADDKQKERLSNQTDSINKVYHEVRKKIVEESEPEKIDMPQGEFDIIYADPPWKYNFSQTNERSIETHYDNLTLDQIKELDIPMSENAVLFLWTTAPKLKEGIEVLESWGFEYKTCAVWDKEIIGMGYWFRGQHEILLVGTRGNVKVPEPQNRFSSMIKSRRERHSKKPEVVYEMIEKMYPNSQYLELFARNNREKWRSWGNEVN